MKRIFCSALIIVLLLASLPTIFALPNSDAVINNKIPENAVQIAEGVFSLGAAKVDGKVVQGFMFLRYRQNFVKPEWVADKTDKTDPESEPYALLSKGTSWKTVEDYVYDTTVSENSISAIEASFDTWQELGYDIFGDRTVGVVDGVDTIAPDEVNEILFGDISQAGVIAMCTVWGIFGGPPKTRELVAFDIIFDNVDFTWGNADDDMTVMDVQNIATHEIGHALGLADLYESTEVVMEQTMYGYATQGETKKRTLAAGDIAGVQALYG